jgi:hypothetical protein
VQPRAFEERLMDLFRDHLEEIIALSGH